MGTPTSVARRHGGHHGCGLRQRLWWPCLDGRGQFSGLVGVSGPSGRTGRVARWADGARVVAPRASGAAAAALGYGNRSRLGAFVECRASIVRAVRVEVAFALLALGLTAALVGMVPARSGAERGNFAAGYDDAADPLSVSLTPARNGANTMHASSGRRTRRVRTAMTARSKSCRSRRDRDRRGPRHQVLASGARQERRRMRWLYAPAAFAMVAVSGVLSLQDDGAAHGGPMVRASS